LSKEPDQLKDQVAKINDYLWARYIEVTDDYPHQLDENEALATLEKFYEDPSEQGNQDIVYLGVLLFERGFVEPDNKLEYFKRAYKLFHRYRLITGEEDWDVVEDRLEDILAAFEEEGFDPESEPVEEEEPSSPEGMVLVPPGSFLYGKDREAAELPAFYIDVHPVTNAEFLAFCEKTGYRKPRFHDDPRFNQPNQPVVGISVADAQQYCHFAGKELPSERRWEKAARGSDGRRYPWGEDAPTPELAHFNHDVDAGRPADVRSLEKGASPFGCLDMSGNVWEWTNTPPVNGDGKPDDGQRVLRGGCYEDPADFLTTFTRLADDSKLKSEIVGFRCVKKA